MLHDVDLAVYPGQVTALVGDNGAGKSTLVKTIAGIYPADAGEFLFEGKPVTFNGPKDAAALGIEIVYQDLALCDNLDIVQNMFLGREAKTPAHLLDEVVHGGPRAPDAGVAVGAHREVGAPERRQPLRWSAADRGHRQGRAVELQVVLLDEPTAALGVAQTRQVLDLVRRLADHGLGVVLISHNMIDVFEVADRITALYLGRVAADVQAAEVNHSQVVELITVGRSGRPRHLRRRPPPSRPEETAHPLQPPCEEQPMTTTSSDEASVAGTDFAGDQRATTVARRDPGLRRPAARR